MKLLSTFRTTLFLSGAIALFTPRALNGQNTNQSSELTCGDATKGLRGEVEVVLRQGKLTDIIVWVNHTADTNPVPPDDVIFGKMATKGWDYYMPTNSFCGPIELRDKDNRILPALKPNISPEPGGMEFALNPDVSSLKAYPPTYSLQTEHGHYLGRFKHGYSGPGVFPLPLFFTIPRTEMVRFQLGRDSRAKGTPPVASLYRRCFQLGDYFELKEPGEYKLTVWPKIYRRSATNDDICQRIDLPPVSVTIKWQGQAAK